MEGLPKINSDKGQLEQVFLNIMKNAIDAVEEGGLVTVSTGTKDQDTVCVSIRDNGTGIPDDKLKQIFEPFLRQREGERYGSWALCVIWDYEEIRRQHHCGERG